MALTRRGVIQDTDNVSDVEATVAIVRKTITLTEQQNAWIAAQIDAGSYTNDSEAIRDLIRREQERGLEMEGLRQALIDGERSGEPEPFDFVAFKRRKAEQHG